ncbi:MAG: hypothetical protein DFNUSKGM_002333 [Candidatus Fervidibacter sacchari]|jgi:hypothetical protein
MQKTAAGFRGFPASGDKSREKGVPGMAQKKATKAAKKTTAKKSTKKK